MNLGAPWRDLRGLRIRPDRQHHRHRPPEGEWRKGGTQAQAIERSRGGLTTKIVALADALGNLVHVVLLPGQRHDTVGVPPLIKGVAFGTLLGDKAFDVDGSRADLDARGAAAVIPPKANRKAQINLDRDMYRWRHLIENTFVKLKEFSAVATRYAKTDTSYAASITSPPPSSRHDDRQQALVHSKKFQALLQLPKRKFLYIFSSKCLEFL